MFLGLNLASRTVTAFSQKISQSVPALVGILELQRGHHDRKNQPRSAFASKKKEDQADQGERSPGAPDKSFKRNFSLKLKDSSVKMLHRLSRIKPDAPRGGAVELFSGLWFQGHTLLCWIRKRCWQPSSDGCLRRMITLAAFAGLV